MARGEASLLLATSPQKAPAVKVGKVICVLSPRLWEQGGQLEVSSWKEAGGAFERAQSCVGNGQALGNKALKWVARSPNSEVGRKVTQLTPRTIPRQHRGPQNTWSGERELGGR